MCHPRAGLDPRPLPAPASQAQLLRSRKLYGTDYHSISTKAVIKCPGAEDPCVQSKQ